MYAESGYYGVGFEGKGLATTAPRATARFRIFRDQFLVGRVDWTRRRRQRWLECVRSYRRASIKAKRITTVRTLLFYVFPKRIRLVSTLRSRPATSRTAAAGTGLPPLPCICRCPRDTLSPGLTTKRFALLSFFCHFCLAGRCSSCSSHQSGCRIEFGNASERAESTHYSSSRTLVGIREATHARHHTEHIVVDRIQAEHERRGLGREARCAACLDGVEHEGRRVDAREVAGA